MEIRIKISHNLKLVEGIVTESISVRGLGPIGNVSYLKIDSQNNGANGRIYELHGLNFSVNIGDKVQVYHRNNDTSGEDGTLEVEVLKVLNSEGKIKNTWLTNYRLLENSV